jgi:hypothetical protein
VQLHQQALSAVDQSEAQRLQQVRLHVAPPPCSLNSPSSQQELEGKTGEMNATAQEVRGTLHAMQSAIHSFGSFGSSDSGSRIMVTVHFTLVKKFTDLLSECVVCN